MDYTTYEFNTVQDLVMQILENEERARNDDKYLTWRVMRHFTNIYIPFSDFNKIPAFETVKRTRAKIQNKMLKFLPTNPDVFKKRVGREAKVRQWATRL